MKDNINLLEGSLTKAIVKLGTPIALGALAQTLYNLADTFWLGKLGKEALSAPVISFFIIFFMISLALGFSVAGTSLVAQYTGSKEKEKAHITTGNLLVCIVLFSFIFGAIGLIFDTELLRLLKTPSDAFDATLSYYRVMMWGMPLAFPIFVYQSVMNGYGDTMSPLKINLFAAAFNVLLDPIMIFGWFGFPVMGIEGAALASVISRGIASLLGMYLFFSGKKGIALKLHHLKLDFKMLPLMFKVGIPSAVGFSGSSLGFMVLIGFVNTFGTAIVSAYGIGMRVIHFFMMPTMGISAAVNAIVGQNLGAGNIDRAKIVVRKGLALMAWILIPAIVLIEIFGKQLTIFFIPGDPMLHDIGRVLFYVSAPSLLFFGISSVLEGAFQGAGHTIPVMVSNLTRIWLFRIPFVYIVSFVVLGGPQNPASSLGIWGSLTFSNFAAALLIFIWYSRGTWAKARIHDEKKN